MQIILAIDPGLANTGIAVGSLDLGTGKRSLLHTELFHTDPKDTAALRFSEHGARAQHLIFQLMHPMLPDNVVMNQCTFHLVYEWPQKNKLPAVCLGVWIGAFAHCEQWGVAPRTWQADMFQGLWSKASTKANSKVRAVLDWGEEVEGQPDHIHDALNMLTWYMDKLILESAVTGAEMKGAIDKRRKQLVTFAPRRKG